MKHILFALSSLLLCNCDSEPKKYKRTSIPMPSRMEVYTSNEAVDALAKPVDSVESYVPRSISFQLESGLARHAEGQIERVYSFKEKRYRFNEEVNAFVASAVLTKPRRNVDFIGLYRDDNFDLFTAVRDFPDSLTTNTSTSITKLEQVGKEYKITYVSSIGTAKTYNRVSFKDTLNQLRWYKIESGQ